jgi:RNA polymerase sigma factor (sigma-70 family)
LHDEKRRRSAPQGETAPSHFDFTQRIDEVLKTLTDTERQVVKLRYGLENGYTYTVEEVGRMLKITPEAVQEIESQAVSKLYSQKQPPLKS